jgi:lysophospholipase L1-like esterase
VFLGTNDWWQGRPLGRFADYQNNTGNATVYGSFRIIIDKLRSLNPKATILLITPMQRTDFVYINDPNNNAYGSYKEKNAQTLEQFANAIDSIGKAEGFPVVDLYHQKGMGVKQLVKFKRLKDANTGLYKNYRYPDYIGVPFHPGTDEYPYPLEAIDVTYDGLHPSDKGYEVISKMLIKIMKKL